MQRSHLCRLPRQSPPLRRQCRALRRPRHLRLPVSQGTGVWRCTISIGQWHLQQVHLDGLNLVLLISRHRENMLKGTTLSHHNRKERIVNLTPYPLVLLGDCRQIERVRLPAHMVDHGVACPGAGAPARASKQLMATATSAGGIYRYCALILLDARHEYSSVLPDCAGVGLSPRTVSTRNQRAPPP
jgi:hypothetical protein